MKQTLLLRYRCPPMPVPNMPRSEMGSLQKVWHSLKQTMFFFLLPVVYLLVTLCPWLEEANTTVQHIIRQSHVPVNRQDCQPVLRSRELY
jgi:hypothetical protein